MSCVSNSNSLLDYQRPPGMHPILRDSTINEVYFTGCPQLARQFQDMVLHAGVQDLDCDEQGNVTFSYLEIDNELTTR